MEMSSFSAFLPAPDLAGSYLGGVSAAQKAQEIANQHQQAQASIAMQGQKLQQEQEQAAMENQIKQQQLQQDSLKAQQELQIKGQYDQQMADLRKQQLATASQALALKTQEAAHQYSAQQQYQSRIQGGEDPLKVFQEMAPLMGQHNTSIGSAMRPPNTAPGTPIQVQGGPPGVADGKGGFIPLMNATMPQQMQQGDQPDSEGESTGVPEPAIPAPSGAQIPQTAQQFGAETARQGVQQRAANSAKQEALTLLQRLESQNEKDFDGQDYASDLVKGKTLTPDQERIARRYLDRQDRMDRLTQKLDPSAPPRKSGVEYKHPKDVPVGGVFNGKTRLPGDWKDPKSWK